MAESRLNISTGNWITIGMFLVGIVSAWAKIQMHISDENIHLSERQRNALIRLSTTIEDKLPNIDKNSKNISEIEKDFAVFKNEFKFLGEDVKELKKK